MKLLRLRKTLHKLKYLQCQKDTIYVTNMCTFMKAKLLKNLGCQ